MLHAAQRFQDIAEFYYTVNVYIMALEKTNNVFYTYKSKITAHTSNSFTFKECNILILSCHSLSPCHWCSFLFCSFYSCDHILLYGLLLCFLNCNIFCFQMMHPILSQIQFVNCLNVWIVRAVSCLCCSWFISTLICHNCIMMQIKELPSRKKHY